MSSITSFEIETSELNIGSVAICADICLAIDGDGHAFELTHAWIDGKRSDDWFMDLAKRWMSGDLARADKKSLVRQAYEDAEAEANSLAMRSAARADFDREMRLSAAL